MIRTVSLGASLLLLTACATTEDTTPLAAQPAVAPVAVAEAPAEASDELDPDAEVCRRLPQTGTRFHRRVCMTRAEWEAQATEARDVTTDMQREVAPAECVLTNGC